VIRKNMRIIIINWIGFVICAVGFGIAFVIGYVAGNSDEGFLMVIAGPIVAVLDIAYRFFSEKGHWLHPDQGGSIFFVPAWCLGTVWLILGIIYMTRGSS